MLRIREEVAGHLCGDRTVGITQLFTDCALEDRRVASAESNGRIVLPQDACITALTLNDESFVAERVGVSWKSGVVRVIIAFNEDHIRGVCRSEEHTSELQSPYDLVCRLLLEKKKQTILRMSVC